MRSPSVVCVRAVPLLVTLLASSNAYATEPDDEPPVVAALLAGGATAALPFSIGGTMMATGRGTETRNAGAMVAMSGLAFAPFVAHGVVGEYRRGAFFS